MLLKDNVVMPKGLRKGRPFDFSRPFATRRHTKPRSAARDDGAGAAPLVTLLLLQLVDPLRGVGLVEIGIEGLRIVSLL